jgi:peptidoglycan endopeptidase LytF
MNRRDTIIIAVLLNAGLLIVLFATSLKSDKTEDATPPVSVLSSNQPETTRVMTPQSTSVVAVPSVSSTDQVDQVIQQFVTPQVTGQEGNQQPNFLADLQAIGTQQPPSPSMESAPAVALQSESIYREVKVKKGDVLERIARQNHVSVDDLMKANKLSSSRLKIGQTLQIPLKESKTMTASVSAPDEAAKYYTIKNGDNPWTIAVKHHMKVDELLKLNNMNEDKARRLKPGDRLRVK